MKSFIIISILVLVVTFCRAQTYFSPPNVISAGLIDSPWTCTAGDIDGDMDMDAVAGSSYYDKLVWYENLNGAGNFGPGKIISSNANNLTSIVLVDLDEDSDLDILAALGCTGKIIWYENLDSHGAFSPAKLITASLEFAFDAQVADIDGDGRPDIIAASREDGEISWFKNLGGHATFGTKQVISTTVPGARCVRAADLDGDDDLDLISDSYWGDFVAWHENKDGLATFDGMQIISDLVIEPMSIFAADLNGDGHMDILSASPVDGKVAWYQNLDGNGHFGPQRLLYDSIGGPNNVIACDVDVDGDMDVVATTMYDDKVVWFENPDGKGNFGPMRIIATDFYFPSSLFAADFDEDGDPDVLATSYSTNQVVWFQNITLQLLSQPQNVTLCPTGQPASFTTAAKDFTGIRWQVSTGAGFKNLYEDPNYSGTATTLLKIAAADTSMSGNRYRCRFDNAIFTIYTDEVTLTVGDYSPPSIYNYFGNQIVFENTSCYTTLADYTQSLTVYDDCDTSPMLMQDPAPGTLVSGAVNTITITGMDKSSNRTNLTFNLEVVDTLVPIIICPENKNINLKPGLKIYPNPASENLFIEFNRDDVTKITLFDLAGNTLLKRSVTRNIEKIDLSGLPDGLYMLSIVVPDEVIVRKVVKME